MLVSRVSKNILVIGGSGFIGSHTADALSKKGHSVTILDKVLSPKSVELPVLAIVIY